MEKEIKGYVEKHLSKELHLVTNSKRVQNLVELNVYEICIIYKYSDDGYQSLNERLRNLKSISLFGKYLNHCLKKLPNYKSLCYRTISCTKSDLNKYYDAFIDDLTIKEPSFLSCTKSMNLARQFNESPLFIILSKNGKDIEKFAKFGLESFGQNEKEILFKNNSRFKVLNITESVDRSITITLEEI